jgi:hypothetical protein
MATFRQRELFADTFQEAAFLLAREFGEPAPIAVTKFPYVANALDALADWEQAVQEQRGRRLRFDRWREYTADGNWRYYSVNRPTAKFAIVEEEPYGAKAIANSAEYVFRSRGSRDVDLRWSRRRS